MSSHFMDNHLNFRMSSYDKGIIQMAAKLKGLKPNTYARQKLVEIAEKDIIEMSPLNTLILSKEDWDFFVDIMEAPIEINEKLKNAIKDYKQNFKKCN